MGYEKILEPTKVDDAAVLLKRHCYTLRNGKGNGIGRITMSEADFITDCLRKGRKPEIRIDRSCIICQEFHCEGDELCDRGETIYCLANENIATQITETGYDFAGYLMRDELITVEESPENDEKEPQTAEQKDQTGEDEPTPETAYEDWLIKSAENYGKNQLEAGKVLILKEIFLDLTGRYDEQSKSLIVLIDNIDKEQCREELISRLTGNDKASEKAFEHITGLKLPKDKKDRQVQLEKIAKTAYKQPVQYTSDKTADQLAYSDTFYITVQRVKGNGIAFIESRGRLWKYRGFDFFVQRCENGLYLAAEGKTGQKVIDNCSSVENLQDSLKSKLAELGDGFENIINGAVEKYGISPLYAISQ